MTILELSKDALLNLTDVQLEQLIGRLAEAEVASCGASVGDVRFAGSITAPDDGVDVRVAVQTAPFSSGFIPRPNTVFQSKKHSMPAGAITKEMMPKGGLSGTISQQCSNGGAYIIVSLDDDCTEPMLTDRLAAMKNAVAVDPHATAIHLGFFDRSKLHQWLRQHPGIMLWVRAVLGQPLSGWQAYGRWSTVPHGMSDDLILASGISVILPEQRHQKLTIEQAIVPTRKMIWASQKAIRIAGLSGVGKTRFVQALFDETVGEAALDRTSVVYVDTGADPVPSARQLLDQLIQDGRKATVVIDNCPPALHSDLASRISSSEKHIKLITVEYDIRDDKPQTTEVIQIEAVGPEIAETLVLRRYPEIGHANARRVAQFSSGNTRVALALADCVDAGESLAQLSDAHLFDRLFQQRHGEDGRLREHAEVLSLMYSFAVEVADGEPDELSVLGSLCGATGDALFSSMQLLVDRQIAQKRGRWRAILPHAIANKLATSALNKMRPLAIRTKFETTQNQRMLTSFAHRLGLMHDHPVAQQIVQAWLSDGGMLVPVIGLDDDRARILDYVAPVCPELLLDRIEADINVPDFIGLAVGGDSRRTTILKMLVSLAYEPHTFDRCLNLLLKIAQHEDPKNNHDSVRDKIVQFFQPYLSGTHAAPEQRAGILKTALWAEDPRQRSLGARMLSKALDGPNWIGGDMGDFGARPRDFGYEPNRAQLAEWRKLFIGIALEAGLDANIDLSECARTTLAQEFRGLWHHAAVRDSLIEASTRLNEQRPWTEGWAAIQSTLYFDYRAKTGDVAAEPIPTALSDLSVLLSPKDLVSSIQTYLFENDHDLWYLDPSFDLEDTSAFEKAQARLAEFVTELGEQFGQSGKSIGELGPKLFSTTSMSYGHAFGNGLARGAHDLVEKWTELVEQLRQSGITNYNCAALSGFIEEAGRQQQGLDRQLLDACLGDPLLRPAIVMLHPRHDFNETDLTRCMQALAYPDVAAWSFGRLLWVNQFSGVPPAKIVELANLLLEKPNGDETLLDALGMKLHATDKAADTLGPELRRLGLVSAISRLGRDRKGNNMIDHHMAVVMAACLANEGNEGEKSAWMDAIFSSVDSHYGYGPGYDETIQMTAGIITEQFLERVFSGNERQRAARSNFLERGGIRRSMLATVDVGRLVDWCRSKSDPSIWSSIAMTIDVFVTSGEEKSASLSEKSIQFLEASPCPDLVLNGFARRITPNAWSGSRAEIMDRNTNLLSALIDHENPDIAAAAGLVVADARDWVSRARDRERREDEAQEQTFE